ncbi:MAG: UvrABC system protein B, partial [Candidatus Roizmanbacteria bacterium GW2011_GWA2_37_7]
ANIPFSVPAAQEFDQAGGKRIPGDFANGGGVFTSTDEILAIQILGREEFTDPERYRQLVADNEALIIRGAEENSWYLWEQYTRAEGRINFVELVQRVTRSMTVVKSIVKVSRLDYNSEDVLNFLFDSLFPSIVETTDRDEIIERMEEDFMVFDKLQRNFDIKELDDMNIESMTPYDKKKMVKKLEREMKHYAEDMNFEAAIVLRDKVREVKKSAA